MPASAIHHSIYVSSISSTSHIEHKSCQPESLVVHRFYLQKWLHFAGTRCTRKHTRLIPGLLISIPVCWHSTSIMPSTNFRMSPAQVVVAVPFWHSIHSTFDKHSHIQRTGDILTPGLALNREHSFVDIVSLSWEAHLLSEFSLLIKSRQKFWLSEAPCISKRLSYHL